MNRQGPESEPTDPGVTRRTFNWKLVAGVAGATVIGGGMTGGQMVIDGMVDQLHHNLTGSEVYEVDGNKVKVSWRESYPKDKSMVDPKKVVIQLGSWSWGAETPIIFNIGQQIADGFGLKTLSISTITDQLGPDALFTEAKGIAGFLQDERYHPTPIEETTIIGHSESGVKGPNLTNILEGCCQRIKVRGLVLIEPMGMYNRDFWEMSESWITNITEASPEEFAKAGKTPPEGGRDQFLLSLYQDLRSYGIRYPFALVEELNTMARFNPRLEKIKAPVLILASDRDRVTNHRDYIPEYEIARRVRIGLSDQELRSWVEQSQKWQHLPAEEQAKSGSQEAFIQSYMQKFRNLEERVRVKKARNQALHEIIFLQSQGVDTLIGTKAAAHHTGLLDSRGELAIRAMSRWARLLKAAA